MKDFPTVRLTQYLAFLFTRFLLYLFYSIEKNKKPQSFKVKFYMFSMSKKIRLLHQRPARLQKHSRWQQQHHVYIISCLWHAMISRVGFFPKAEFGLHMHQRQVTGIHSRMDGGKNRTVKEVRRRQCALSQLTHESSVRPRDSGRSQQLFHGFSLWLHS